MLERQQKHQTSAAGGSRIFSSVQAALRSETGTRPEMGRKTENLNTDTA